MTPKEKLGNDGFQDGSVTLSMYKIKNDICAVRGIFLQKNLRLRTGYTERFTKDGENGFQL